MHVAVQSLILPDIAVAYDLVSITVHKIPYLSKFQTPPLKCKTVHLFSHLHFFL